MTAPESRTNDDLLFLRTLTPFVRRWKVLMGVPLALGTVSVAISLLLPRNYTARTTFTPQASRSTVPGGSLAGLAGLAGQFGISLTSGTDDSPEFFAEVLTSREMLQSTLMSSFAFPDSDSHHSPRTLLSVLNIDGNTDLERISKGIRQFEKKVTTSVDKRTGIVSLEVELPSPELAANVANRMVQLLNIFNVERLQLQSHEERRFTEARLAEAQQELDSAEQAQVHFLQANRRYSDSPLLAFEADRLQRKVQLRQDIVLTLQREYEQARIAEVRDTPVLTIIDKAIPPDKTSSPKLLLNLLVAVIAGVLLALSWVYFSQSTAVVAQVNGEEYRAFQEAYRNAFGEVRGFLRLKGGSSQR